MIYLPLRDDLLRAREVAASASPNYVPFIDSFINNMGQIALYGLSAPLYDAILNSYLGFVNLHNAENFMVRSMEQVTINNEVMRLMEEHLSTLAGDEVVSSEVIDYNTLQSSYNELQNRYTGDIAIKDREIVELSQQVIAKEQEIVNKVLEIGKLHNYINKIIDAYIAYRTRYLEIVSFLRKKGMIK